MSFRRRFLAAAAAAHAHSLNFYVSFLSNNSSSSLRANLVENVDFLLIIREQANKHLDNSLRLE
jgi:hypothetical protein